MRNFDSRRRLRFGAAVLTVRALTACSLLASLPACSLTAERGVDSRLRPNIVLILADDMGYGDIAALNPASRIATPHLDGMAAAGMVFLDAHSPSAVCTPTRYGTLTGRYCWRSRLKRGVLGGYSEPLLERDRATLGTLLQGVGYRTAAVGKWHLGMDLPLRDGAVTDRKPWAGDIGVDFTGTIADSPIHHGFDEFFGVSASLDMAPYVFIRNDGFTMVPTEEQPSVPFPHFVRNGPRAADFIIDEVLDRLVGEATGFIERAAADDAPFFLYLPFTAPHKPTQPHERFRGVTALGEYGDFIAQVDWSVGQVVEALADAGVADTTLVLFTSDNGSYMFRFDDPSREDHVDRSSVQGYRADRHRANHVFRGTKADIWEGGHHVPFLVRWPGVVQAGSTSARTTCHVDIYATVAEIVEAGRTPGDGEDSVSFLAALRGSDEGRGVPVIHDSGSGMFAIRDGRYKLVLGSGSGGREKPRGKPFEQPYALFDLEHDPAETACIAAERADVVERLTATFHAIHEPSVTR